MTIERCESTRGAPHAPLTKRAGVTFVEVIIASSILATLMLVAMSFMNSQAQLGRQQQTRAFGQAEAQRVHNNVAEIMRGGAVIVAESDLCTNTLTHHFARIKLYMIDRVDPFVATTTTDPLPFKLNVITPARGIIEVRDTSGALVAKTYDASLSANPPGRIRFWIDLNNNDVLDSAETPTVRDLASDVMRFRVIDEGTRFLVDLSFKLRTGDGRADGVAVVESTGTTGQVLAAQYDPEKME